MVKIIHIGVKLRKTFFVESPCGVMFQVLRLN